MRDVEPLIRPVDERAARDRSRFRRARDHLIERDSVREQPLRIHLHLELPVALPPHRDVGDARYRHEPRPNRPQRQRRHVHLRQRVRLHADLQHPARRRERRQDDGRRATEVSSLAAIVTRSWTTCRACMMSMPSWKNSVIDERPSTDFERIVTSHGEPFSALSSGTVTSASTSSAERPGTSV